jgi:hypothetical protein
VPGLFNCAGSDNEMVTRAIALVALTASVLTLSGCETLDSSPQPWVGGSIDEAMRVQGVPSETADLSGHRKAYTWLEHRGDVECWLTLTADSQGIIQSYRYRRCTRVGNTDTAEKGPELVE